MACTGLDPMTFVPQSFPCLMACRSYGCPCPRPFPTPRHDFTREFFCNRWGPSFCCICPPQKSCRNPCGPHGQGSEQFRGVGKEMESLDYFSALPWRREGRFVGSRDLPTLQQEYRMAWVNPCLPKPELCFSQTCPQGTRLKPDLVKDDSTCGICAPVGQPCNTPKDLCDDGFPGFDMSGRNLGFSVEFTEWPECKPPTIRTGVQRCIQPSKYRDWETVYTENYKDFMKIKTPKQILLYRSPLAIDKRRPGPKIPCDTNTDLVVPVNSGPICVKAQAVQYEVRKKCPPCPPCLPKRPDFEVILPGAICLI